MMIILLASKEFVNNDITHNLETIHSTINEYSSKVDLIIFGEAYLQGFDALRWNYEEDKHIAIEQSSPIIKEIAEACKKGNIAISFGYYEKDDEHIYDSYITISKDGEIVNNYRRVSIGWKEKYASKEYAEGDGIIKFTLEDKSFAIALCGDGWDENNVLVIRDLDVDILLWPLYVDFKEDRWNKELKYEYAFEAKKMAKRVLLVNSLNYEKDALARGGAIYFLDGIIKDELPAGGEGTLIIDID